MVHVILALAGLLVFGAAFIATTIRNTRASLHPDQPPSGQSTLVEGLLFGAMLACTVIVGAHQFGAVR